MTSPTIRAQLAGGAAGAKAHLLHGIENAPVDRL